MTVASIDIGTKTVLLLVADIKDNTIHLRKYLHSIQRIGKDLSHLQKGERCSFSWSNHLKNDHEFY